MSTSPVATSWTIAGRSGSGGIADRDVEGAELVAERTQALGVLVQDRREERCLSDLERLGDVTRSTCAAGCDHGNTDRVRDERRQLEVVAVSRPVGVDRRQQDLAGAALLGLARPVDGAAAGFTRARVRANA